jgi:hypothetical protein
LFDCTRRGVIEWPQSLQDLYFSNSSPRIYGHICQNAGPRDSIRGMKGRDSLYKLGWNKPGTSGQLEKQRKNYWKHGALYNAKVAVP